MQQKRATMRLSLLLGSGAVAGLTLVAHAQDGGGAGSRFVDIAGSMLPENSWNAYAPPAYAPTGTITWSLYEGNGFVFIPGWDGGPQPRPDFCFQPPAGAPNQINVLTDSAALLITEDEDADEILNDLIASAFEKWDAICGINLAPFNGNGREEEDWVDIDPEDGCDLDGTNYPDAWEEDEGNTTLSPGCGNNSRVGDIRISIRPIDGPEGRRFIAFPPVWHGPGNLLDGDGDDSLTDPQPEPNTTCTLMNPAAGFSRFPGEGMAGNIILDSADFNFGPGEGELFLREWEHYFTQAIGIAIGLTWDCPDGETLMALDGNEHITEPQVDDIRAAQYLYGSNGSEASEFPTPNTLPFFVPGTEDPIPLTVQRTNLSIVASDQFLDPTQTISAPPFITSLNNYPGNDVDIFHTFINDLPVGFRVRVEVTPTGGLYRDSTQVILPPVFNPDTGEPEMMDELGFMYPDWAGIPFVAPGPGTCLPSDLITDATRQIDLQLHYYGPDRVLLQTADSAGLGQPEVIEFIIPPNAPGDYYFAVTGDGDGDNSSVIPYEVQLYDLDVQVFVDIEASARTASELIEFVDADLLWALGFTGETKRIGIVEGFAPNEDHVVLTPRVEEHIAWQGEDPVIDEVSRHATATAGVAAGSPYDENFEGFTGAAIDATIVTAAIAREELAFGSFAVSAPGLHYALFGMADPSILTQGENVTERVTVINESWGSPLADITASGVTALANDALVSMTDTLVIAAAGNEGMLQLNEECPNGVDNTEIPGARFRGSKTVGSPATAFNVLSVGATGLDTVTLNQFNNIVPTNVAIDDILEDDPLFPISQFTQRYANTIVPSFSSKGPIDAWNYSTSTQVESTRAGVHLVAPGVGTVLRWPLPTGEDAQEPDVLCPLVSGIPLSGLLLPTIPEAEIDLGGPFTNDFFTTSFDGPEALGGTSFSAALVSGTALLLQEYGESEGLSTDPLVMKAVLMNSATRLPGWSPGGNLNYPNVIPLTNSGGGQFVALDVAQGAGVLNARAALEQYSRGATDLPITDPEFAVKTEGNITPGFEGGRQASSASGAYINNLQRTRLRPSTREVNARIRASQKNLPETEIGFERADKDDPDLGNPVQGPGGVGFQPRPPFAGGGGGGGGSGGGVGGPGNNGNPFFIITEIMYHPASSPEEAFEWVEIYNAGADLIDLTGYVFDDEVDDDEDLLDDANIAGGFAPPRGTAILFNGDALDFNDMVDIWGPGNYIPVTNWPGLSNNGEGIGLWMSMERYGNGSFNTAAVALGYGVSRPWPEDNARSSIYLTDLAANPAMGANWALSEDGVAGAYISAPAGGNGGTNIGSPGIVRQPSVIITEIMYNPASSPDETWEWVEIYNPLAEAVDLTGWVLDNFIDEANDTIGGANIAGGTIEPGETAILFNGDELEVADIEAVWGEGNWIPVTNWPGLMNDGDIVALWSSFDAYDDEDFDNEAGFRGLDNTQFFVSYDDTAPWPEDDGRGSIFLLDVNASSSVDPSRWALSVEGVGGAYRSARAGDNQEFNVGSPANFSGLPEIGIQPVAFIGWDHARIGQINGQGFVDYLIDSPLEQGEVISVTLTWNRHVTVSDPDFSDPDNPTYGQLLELELEDLGLQLWRSDEFGNIFDEDPEELLVAGSNHGFDTVEHFQTTIQLPSFYVIRVFWGGTNYDLFANMSPADVEYAVAWRVTPQPNRFFGFMELNRLLDAWGSTIDDDNYDRWVDIDYDFDVDFEDLSALLEGWRN